MTYRGLDALPPFPPVYRIYRQRHLSTPRLARKVLCFLLIPSLISRQGFAR